MSILVNERAYARGLRASADETRRAMMAREMTEETRSGHGDLRRAILAALDDRPRLAAEIADTLGRSRGAVICVLRRLEAAGLAQRQGEMAAGRPSLWVSAEARP